MSAFTLILGSKAYSSWSLRPWLLMRQAGLAFDEVVIPLRQADTRARILHYSPAGKVPVLIHHRGMSGGGTAGDLVVWDSLAIAEYVAEIAADARLWPEDRAVRAHARSVCAEMHGGFQDLRRNLFMDLKRRLDQPQRVVAAAADIARVQEIWRTCRQRHGAGGPFLFGHFTVADAMYAPVVTRFATFGVPLEGEAAEYAATIEALPAMRDWYQAAADENRVIDMLGDC